MSPRPHPPRLARPAMLIGLLLCSHGLAAQVAFQAAPPSVQQVRAQIERSLRLGIAPLGPTVDSLLGLLPDTTQRRSCLSVFEQQGIALADAHIERFLAASAQHPDIGAHAPPATDSLSALLTQRLAELLPDWQPLLNTMSNAEQRQVLALFMTSVGVPSTTPEAQRRSARAFMRAYPASDYYSYVEARRAQLNTAQWRAHASYTAIAPYGYMGNLALLHGALTVGTGGVINRLYLSASATMGRGSLRREVQQVRPDNGAPFDAAAGTSLRYMHMCGRVGAQVYAGRHLEAIARVSLSSLSLSLPPQEGRTTTSSPVASATGVGLGVQGQLALLRWGTNGRFALALQLGADYMLLPKSGSALTFDVGLGLAVGSGAGPSRRATAQ